MATSLYQHCSNPSNGLPNTVNAASKPPLAHMIAAVDRAIAFEAISLPHAEHLAAKLGTPGARVAVDEVRATITALSFVSDGLRRSLQV